MWRSSQGLLRKLTVKVGSGVLVSVRQRRMSTVMSFGYGWYGALGLPTVGMREDTNAYKPTPIPSLPSDIVSVHAGHHHSLALTSQGQLWAWGRNEGGQLGRGLCNRKSWSEPKRVEGLENVNVCTASASGVVSAAIGDDGSVWVWGKSRFGQLGLGKHITEAVIPARVEALSGLNITKISFGFGHAFAQTEDGKLFRWGGNLDIEEDTGERKWLIIWEPRLVEELRGLQVLDIACGRDHSLILCCDGTLLSCGDGDNWQLGRRNNNDLVFFDSRLLPVEMSFRPISIAAGMDHSLAICQLDESNGVKSGTTKIASWGWDYHSQLGRSTDGDILPGLIDALDEDILPGLIDALDEDILPGLMENPISVSAGRTHSLALTSKGELWVWGSGLDGRLGFDSYEIEAEPCHLDSLEGFQILQAVSGLDHNLVLVAD